MVFQYPYLSNVRGLFELKDYSSSLKALLGTDFGCFLTVHCQKYRFCGGVPVLLCLIRSTSKPLCFNLFFVLFEDFLQLQRFSETALLKKESMSIFTPLFSYLRTILSSVMFVLAASIKKMFNFCSFTVQITVNFEHFRSALL